MMSQSRKRINNPNNSIRRECKYCKICYSNEHTIETHKCKVCKGLGHRPSNHQDPKSKFFVGYYCEYCGPEYKSDHNTQHHKCEFCGMVGHSETEHQCRYCSGRHSTNEHECQDCGGLHSRFFALPSYIDRCSELVLSTLVDMPRDIVMIIINYGVVLAHYKCDKCPKYHDTYNPPNYYCTLCKICTDHTTYIMAGGTYCINYPYE